LTVEGLTLQSSDIHHVEAENALLMIRRTSLLWFQIVSWALVTISLTLPRSIAGSKDALVPANPFTGNPVAGGARQFGVGEYV
jgi:hypothetical protein